jgi:hypothetical protein
MDELFRRIEQVAERVQMLLSIFSTKGVLPLGFEPAHIRAPIGQRPVAPFQHRYA